MITGGGPCSSDSDCFYESFLRDGRRVSGGTCVSGKCSCFSGSLGSRCQCRPDALQCGSGLVYWLDRFASYCSSFCPDAPPTITSPCQRNEDCFYNNGVCQSGFVLLVVDLARSPVVVAVLIMWLITPGVCQHVCVRQRTDPGPGVPVPTQHALPHISECVSGQQRLCHWGAVCGGAGAPLTGEKDLSILL